MSSLQKNKTPQRMVLIRTDTALNINHFEQSMCKLDTSPLRTDRRASGNSTFAIGGNSCSADSLEVAESFVLRINICGKNPAHRKSANRQAVKKLKSSF